MRNKSKKASPLRWMLRRYVFLLVAVVMITFAAFPMQGMTRVMSVRWSLEQLEEGEELTSAQVRSFTAELTKNFVYSPLNLEMLCLLFGGLGFAAALVLFRHLFSRKQGMLVAALPMTRSEDFLRRCLVYGLWVLLPMGLCMMIHPLVVFGNGLSACFDLRIYLLRAAATLLINLYGFALGAFCAAVFGTFWSSCLGGMMIAGSAELVAFCWVWIASDYLPTLYRHGLLQTLRPFSPVYSLYKAFYDPGLRFPLPGILAAAVLLVLGWLAYGRVKPENAGHTLNMKKLEPVILFWTTVLGGTAGAIVLTMYLGRESMLYVGLLLGAAAGGLLARMLLDQRIQLSLKSWPVPAAAVCVLLLALLGLRGDVLGFNAYAPQAADLTAVRVYPEMGGEELLLTSGESVEACLTWAGQMREEALAARRETPYQSMYANVVMKFEEKGGRIRTRQYAYPQDQAAVVPALRVLAAEASRQQAEKVRALTNIYCYSRLNTFGLSSQEFLDTFGFSPEDLSYRRLNPEKVAEALREDLRARTLESLQEPALLNVYFEGLNPETGEYEYSDTSYQIRSGDVHTLQAVLGDEAEKWADYAAGGFARADRVRVFLCEYSLEGDEERLESFRLAESEAEVREWMTHVTGCSDTKFQLPLDRTHRVKVYSLNNLQELADYGELELDPEDPEVLRRLPELMEFGAVTYTYTAADL